MEVWGIWIYVGLRRRGCPALKNVVMNSRVWWSIKRLGHNAPSFTVKPLQGRPEISQFSPKIYPLFNREKQLRQSVFSCGNVTGIYVQHFKYIWAFFWIMKQTVTNILSMNFNTSSGAKQMVMVRVPFNTAKSTQDGHILGGTPTTIQYYPYLVKLLKYCWTELFLWCIET
jgi:hypothetical protein